MSKFDGLLSFSEAAYLWGLDDSTLRKAVSSHRLIDGIDCRKFGKQWVIDITSMQREYGVIKFICKDCGNTFFNLSDDMHLFDSCVCEVCGGNLDRLTLSKSGC